MSRKIRTGRILCYIHRASWLNALRSEVFRNKQKPLDPYGNHGSENFPNEVHVGGGEGFEAQMTSCTVDKLHYDNIHVHP